MAYISIYKNNPTAGIADGSKVGAGNPVITPYLDLSIDETANVKLAIRCDTGYASLQPTIITPAAPESTLTAEAAVGATAIIVAATTGLQIGNRIDIGAAGTLESKRITSITGMTLTIDSALANTQAIGAAVACKSKSQMALASDNAGSPATFGEWGAPLTISGTITDVNTIFWAKFRAQAIETIPYNDNSGSLALSYKVGSV
jgi:hypothetical protein